MAVQRICTMEDKPYLRALWQSCFGDSDSFLDYYFADYWYYQFLIKSSDKYGVCATRYINYYGWTEEQLFINNSNAIISSPYIIS